MLSTSNLPSAGTPKTFGPGNQELRVSSVELAKGYKEGSYQVKIHMEGPDQGENFEGFYIDNITKSGERYKGQVGTVRMSQYAYDNTTTKSGTVINRDQSILRGLQNLAKVLGVQAELDAIEADTIEDYVPLASDVLSAGTYANFCIGGKEYINKAGYVQYDMFLPNSKPGQYAFTALGEDPSKLMAFDPAVHIIKIASATPPSNVSGFESDKKSSFAL